MKERNWRTGYVPGKAKTTLHLDEDNYAWLLREAAERSLREGRKVSQSEIVDELIRKERMKVKRLTLQDLTGQESGIIIYNGKVAKAYNWSSFDGIPYDTPIGPVALPQAISEVPGERCELAELLAAVELEFDEELPTHGTVYRISDDITVIAPDGWV